MIIETKYTDQDLCDEEVFDEIEKIAKKEGSKDFFICYNEMQCLYEDNKIVKLPLNCAVNCFGRVITIDRDKTVKTWLSTMYYEANKIKNKKVFISSKDDEMWNHFFQVKNES